MKKTIASLTIFRNQQDLDAYFAELPQADGPRYSSATFTLPPFPFAGRVILDDDLFFVEFLTISPEDAVELGLALN